MRDEVYLEELVKYHSSELTMSAEVGLDMQHVTLEEIETGLEEVRCSPADFGRVMMIVRRPAIGEREVLESAELDLAEGLIGDSWRSRPSSRTQDRAPHPDMQLNVMNARSIALFARTPERWPLAGDQLFVDLDLSGANLPAGTRLKVGEAEIEVTDQPHLGCAKFRERFGVDALKVVNSSMGRELNLRGICARVVRGGRIHVGDVMTKTERR